jgi:hypothetical protein
MFSEAARLASLTTKLCLRIVMIGVLATTSGVAQDSVLPKSATPTDLEMPDFEWRPALRQSMTFLTIQQSFRILTQESTRAEMTGPYFRDWLTSVGNLRGWGDSDPFIANYVAHPMEGAIAGYIQIQNDRLGRTVQFGDELYWRSRLRALMWSAVYSTNYELGPLGDGAIGNVGMTPGTKGAVDLVITPTLGMAWLVTEDALDRHLVSWIEKKWHSPKGRMLVRSWLNPSRSMANVLRGRWPWYRDTRPLHWGRQTE